MLQVEPDPDDPTDLLAAFEVSLESTDSDDFYTLRDICSLMASELRSIRTRAAVKQIYSVQLGALQISEYAPFLRKPTINRHLLLIIKLCLDEYQQCQDQPITFLASLEKVGPCYYERKDPPIATRRYSVQFYGSCCLPWSKAKDFVDELFAG